MEPIAPEPMPVSAAARRYGCSNCGYNLVGVRIGDPCPECGKLFLLGEATEQRAGKAVASMVLGIISVFSCMFYGVPGLVCGIIAVVLAKRAREAVRLGEAPAFSLDFAKAGKVCGWVGICLSGLFFLLVVLYMVFVVALIGTAARGGMFTPPGPAPTPVTAPAPPASPGGGS